MARKIGLAALTVLELAPPEQVTVAAGAGYDCVGLRLIPVPGQVLPVFDERETAGRLADTGMQLLLARKLGPAERAKIVLASAREFLGARDEKRGG